MVLTILVTGCLSDDGSGGDVADDFDGDDFDGDDFDGDDFDGDEFDGDEFDDTAVGRCTGDELGADELTTFVTAHRVVDGTLSSVCFGPEDDDLLDAWNALETITPPAQLNDLALFSGFESGEEGDEVTLAYVVPIDDDGSQYQMAINLDEYQVSPDEALLTIAHEFTHVFNQMPSQLDRSAETLDDCPTYDNGSGCFYDDSLMWAWIREFWPPDVLAEVDPFADATVDDGADRCDRDPGFFGPYAASNPDEDFAESFSAFAFDVPAATPEQQDRIDWMAEQPGLAEFRDRARYAGLTPVPNEFERCG